MVREIINKKYRSGGSPHNDFIEEHGGIDTFANQSDAESLRNWQAEQARADSDEEIQLEAILETFNTGGLTELTPIQQKVFQLCVVEDVAHDVVSNQLKISRQMVEKHLSRACKTLEELASLRVKRVALQNTKWTKESIREIAKKFTKKPENGSV